MSDFIWFGLIGMAMGLLSYVLRKSGNFSDVGDITAGTFGALMGGFLFRFVSADVDGLPGSLATAAVGAVLLVLALRLIQKSYAERDASGEMLRPSPPMLKGEPLLSDPAEAGGSRTQRNL